MRKPDVDVGALERLARRVFSQVVVVERTPHGIATLVQDLLAGYEEVTPLSEGDRELVRRAAILLGLRQLSRWLGPLARFGSRHALALSRAERLKDLLR